MPPPIDEYERILGQVEDLRHELASLRDRPHARNIKARIMELREGARLVHSRIDLADLARLQRLLDELVTQAQLTITRTLGASAWDEPGPGSEPPPPTEEEQDAALGRYDPLSDAALEAILRAGSSVDPATRRLAAEVRRLRSDAWLEAAAAELGGWVIAPVPSTVVAILRKHRDRKA